MFNQWSLTSYVQRREDVLNCSDGERLVNTEVTAIQGPYLWLIYRKPFLYFHMQVVHFLKDKQESNFCVCVWWRGGGHDWYIQKASQVHASLLILALTTWVTWPLTLRRHCPPQGSYKGTHVLTVSPPSVTVELLLTYFWQIVIESAIFAGHLANAGWLKAIINSGWGEITPWQK